MLNVAGTAIKFSINILKYGKNCALTDFTGRFDRCDYR